MEHVSQQISYNAGWCKGRWPNDPNYRYSVSDFTDAKEFLAGRIDGARARRTVEAS